MSGLEKILKHIEDNANNNAKELIEKANMAAEKIVNKAEEESNAIFIQKIEQCKADVDAFISFSEASAALKKKQIILDSKQQIIKDLINRAKDYIIKLPKEEYFEVILKMLTKYCIGKSGQIIFSQYDRERMPEQFEQQINKAISTKEGVHLEISDETRSIDGGFVLNYGEIEQNCSFDALFLDKYDLLQDEVYKLLFDESTV